MLAFKLTIPATFVTGCPTGPPIFNFLFQDKEEGKPQCLANYGCKSNNDDKINDFLLGYKILSILEDFGSIGRHEIFFEGWHGTQNDIAQDSNTVLP